jgi:hypothetical protein
MKQDIYVEEITLTRPHESFKAGLCLGEFSRFANYEAIVNFLHPQERKYVDQVVGVLPSW